MRTYVCRDCPPAAGDYPAGARGPLPDRCPAHRARREAQQARRRRSGLSVVGPDAPTKPPAALERAPDAPTVVTSAGAGGAAAALEATLAELATTHPAQHVLIAAARRLAELIDDPGTIALDGPRAVPALTKELRAILDALVEHEEAESDDLFGGAGSPTPVVVPASS